MKVASRTVQAKHVWKHSNQNLECPRKQHILVNTCILTEPKRTDTWWIQEMMNTWIHQVFSGFWPSFSTSPRLHFNRAAFHSSDIFRYAFQHTKNIYSWPDSWNWYRHQIQNLKTLNVFLFWSSLIEPQTPDTLQVLAQGLFWCMGGSTGQRLCFIVAAHAQKAPQVTSGGFATFEGQSVSVW